MLRTADTVDAVRSHLNDGEDGSPAAKCTELLTEKSARLWIAASASPPRNDHEPCGFLLIACLAT